MLQHQWFISGSCCIAITFCVLKWPFVKWEVIEGKQLENAAVLCKSFNQWCWQHTADGWFSDSGYNHWDSVLHFLGPKSAPLSLKNITWQIHWFWRVFLSWLWSGNVFLTLWAEVFRNMFTTNFLRWVFTYIHPSI